MAAARRRMLALLTTLIVGGLATAAWWLHRPVASPTPLPVPTDAQLSRLRQQINDAEREAAKAVAAYAPAAPADLGDLSVPVADVLRRLPGVVSVDVMVASSK